MYCVYLMQTKIIFFQRERERERERERGREGGREGEKEREREREREKNRDAHFMHMLDLQYCSISKIASFASCIYNYYI